MEQGTAGTGGGGRRGRRGRRGRAAKGTEVAGVRLTSPDRVLYPEQGTTKLELAHYYLDVGERIMPFVRDRPLALVRCPQGEDSECFYQKHPGEGLFERLARVEITESEGPGHYLYVREVPDLVALVQGGVLELHVWGSRVDDVERPDQLVFDLDPAPAVQWELLLRVARELRERLTGLGLASFPRVTGGKGLHLVVPLERGVGWEEAKAFARALAAAQASDDPQVTVEMSKAKREGRVFLDYLRNGRGATAICSYSTRARAGAPVAVPVRWDEVTKALRPDRYDIGNVRRRLSALRGDPWQGFEEARRPLSRDLLAKVGVS